MLRVEEVMGFPVSVEVADPVPADVDAALDRAFGVLHAADARFSSRRPTSEISALRSGGLLPAHYSNDLRQVMDIAERAEQASGGVFRVTTPDGRWDTDGVVKGWAAQRAADELVASGVTTFCLNAGGDIVARGCPEPGHGWSIAVRDPRASHGVLAVLDLHDAAIATSGTYERGAHVWDGRTGSTDLPTVSATVLAGDLVTADVLATTLLAMGADGASWAIDQGAEWVLVVDRDGHVCQAIAASADPR
jgi:FAD:protein FMN transferase